MSVSTGELAYVEARGFRSGRIAFPTPGPALGSLLRLPTLFLVGVVVAALICGWAAPLVGFLGGLLIVDLIVAANARAAHRRALG